MAILPSAGAHAIFPKKAPHSLVSRVNVPPKNAEDNLVIMRIKYPPAQNAFRHFNLYDTPAEVAAIYAIPRRSSG